MDQNMHALAAKARRVGSARCALLGAVAILVAVTHAARADTKVLVLLCKGTAHCGSCRDSEKKVDFDWTYTIDFSASTVDGHPAKITNQNIIWQFKSDTVLDEREISRFSKKLHYAGKALSGGGEIYYGDGTCEPQEKKAF
jgi:hypothetical protein